MYLCISSLAEASILQEDPTKDQVLHVTLKTLIPSKYFLHNTELESVFAAKYLGVTISGDLRWGKHIDEITKKANQTIGFLV